jgi:hypothetical protein
MYNCVGMMMMGAPIFSGHIINWGYKRKIELSSDTKIVTSA